MWYGSTTFKGTLHTWKADCFRILKEGLLRVCLLEKRSEESEKSIVCWVRQIFSNLQHVIERYRDRRARNES